MVYIELLRHEMLHFLLSSLAAIAVLLYLQFKKKKINKLILFIILGAFIGEFFLDADHIFDYFVAFGFSFHPDYFFQGKMFLVNHKTFVPLHSWEFIIILLIWIKFIKNVSLKYFVLAVTLGLLFHLVYDTFYSHITLLGYSFIYRMIHGFSPDYFALPGH